MFDLYERVSELMIRPEMFVAENQAPTLQPLAVAFSELASREQLLVKMQDKNIAALNGDG